jgi:hypothetical protein
MHVDVDADADRGMIVLLQRGIPPPDREVQALPLKNIECRFLLLAGAPDAVPVARRNRAEDLERP